jgi:sarcosine oxidase
VKVAVVGAGIVGASASRFLALNGHDVTLFEQYPIGHTRGSSHGQSRIVRRAYPDAVYTRYMQDAYPMWEALEKDSGSQLLHEVGLLYFGQRSSSTLSDVAASLQTNAVPHEILEGPELLAAGQNIQFQPNEVGIWTPGAGWVHAERALRATLELAVKSGVRVRIGKADLQGFDASVVAAGAWIGDFVEVQVTVSKQTFAYVDGKVSGPVWIEDSSDFAYGFPSEPSTSTFKIGIHRTGPTVHDLDAERPVEVRDLRAITEAAKRRFGQERIVEAKTCLYTSTSTEDFVLGRLAPNQFFASACSGHGFKFGPWIGKRLSDFVEGTDSPENYPRFCSSGATSSSNATPA